MITEKECTKCGEVKDIESFSNAKYTSTGFTCWCKDCKKEADALYRKNNKERLSRQRKEHYQENKELFSERGKKYRKENKELVAKGKADQYRSYKKQWIEFLASIKELRCESCGYNKCFAALDYHHTRDKLFHIPSKMMKALTDSNKEEVRKEVNKCTILCANCHREHHHEAKEKL